MNELTPRECWDLLASSEVGRLAVCLGDAPEIFPVNYVVANGTIVLRTAPGLKHVAARLNELVAFEVDGVDREARIAWSVVLKGRARDITAENEVEFARTLPLRPMHGGAKNMFVRLEPESVTGRRFSFAEPDRWVGPDGLATVD